MDNGHFSEMTAKLDALIQAGAVQNQRIYLFGHCHATEELAALLAARGFPAAAILDNNSSKQGRILCGLPVIPPEDILLEQTGKTIVCVAARAYASMLDQLRRIGYQDPVYQLVNYNSYAEYSLAEDTIIRMRGRMEQGRQLLCSLEREFEGYFRILCPFPALGDVYIMMSYLPYFLEKRQIRKCVVGVIGNACAQVVELFGAQKVKVFSQEGMDKTVQAALFTRNSDTFIAHQDRPYVTSLHGALYQKRIPLEQMYCCGVFGLPAGTKPCKPIYHKKAGGWPGIAQGKAVVLSPYAKSVPALPDSLWRRIVSSFSGEGFQCFTNVAGNERPLPGTEEVRVPLNQMRSLLEWAGVFIGIRSGICDVLKEADCRKIALYPDYNYCDTQWKANEIYYLDGWENLVVNEGFQWNLS